MNYKLTRLSLEEAKQYVPFTKEYRDIDPAFYTREVDEDGWAGLNTDLGKFEI